jgi:hypothetical protein
LIAQLEQVLESVQAQESQLAQGLVLVQVLVLVQEQVLVLQPAQVQEQGSQLALVQVQVQHPLHQPPQSLFQPQPSLLLQREFR